MRKLRLLCLLLLGSPIWAQQPLPTYLPAGTPDVDGMHNLVLIYHGSKSRPRWDKPALLPYVAFVDEQGEPRDWLFDGFLFIEYTTDDGAYLESYLKSKRLPTIADWVWLADGWFRPESGLSGLEQAVAEAGQKLGVPDRKVQVVITMPAPFRVDRAFGPLPGATETLDFALPRDRQRALRWYVDRVRAAFGDHRYQHLTLAGFYWSPESIRSEDRPLVAWTSGYLKGLGLNHYWIPYLGATSIHDWRDLGFAGMMIQPNYFFPKQEPHVNRFQVTSKIARLAGAGLEVEFDGRVLTSDEFRARMLAYFDAGVFYGWMGHALLGYYEGGGAMAQLVKTPGRGRELYQKLYEFTKGTYQPSGLYDFTVSPLVTRDNRDNLALATRGARLEGAERRPEWGDDIGPEKIIDGDIDFYGGMSGYGAFGIPGNFIVELPRVAQVARTQTMFFDLDDRFYRYRVDTSVDKVRWVPAVDKAAGEWRGWQVDTFPPRQARYVRLTVLYDSFDTIAQIVEFEVYSNPL